MPEDKSDYLNAGPLLDERGELIQSGYAFSQEKQYSRAAVKGKKLRIKEWDYYYFGDDRVAVALTIADNSYMSLGSVSVLDFEHLQFTTKSKIGLLPMGKLKLPPACDSGDIVFEKGGVKIRFENKSGRRKLSCEYKNFDRKTDLACEINLEEYSGDNITVATPFEKKRQFYYNTKINNLRGSGWLTFGDKRVEFHDAYGGLDWGRGVWPYKNVWYWSSLSTEVDGTSFGFNLGYGFGKPAATENTLFYGGKAHKLQNVKFDIPYTLGKLDYLKAWKITDDEDRLSLTFFPMIDRTDKMKALMLSTDQHQVFGKFYGRATLDDGTIISVENKIGFAEHVKNNW